MYRVHTKGHVLPRGGGNDREHAVRRELCEPANQGTRSRETQEDHLGGAPFRMARRLSQLAERGEQGPSNSLRRVHIHIPSGLGSRPAMKRKQQSEVVTSSERPDV